MACGRGLNPRCDACGLPMVKRLNSATRRFFYGCFGYPTCRTTKPFHLARLTRLRACLASSGGREARLNKTRCRDPI